ncbi:MAG TPA: pseudouridine synthase, partial [Candidatus Dormibacteraeota bacterium]|nr:pseudouridine synthase [Candidatus Dormibacteraeota bacterium]
MPSERLQKIMAASGMASRRKAEGMIAAGRVTLNGKVVTEQGTKADPDSDVICVDGTPLKKRERPLYFLLNKPKGYVTTVSDPEGRPTVMQLMKDCPERVYPVGRLDYASEGLLLMTNDGDLAAKLMKAGSHVPKTYLVKVSGKPDEAALQRLRGGIVIGLEDGKRVKTSPA